MENHNTTENRRTLLRFYDPTGNTVGQYDLTVPAIRDIVNFHSVVQGDKKNPMDFMYRTTNEVGYYGKEEVYETSPMFYRTSSLEGQFGSFLSDRLESLTWNRDALYNLALSRLIEKVRGQLDLSVAVAESHSTARMLNVYDRVSRYFEGVPAAKAGFRWTQPLRELGGKWLEWHLGLRPLLQDMYGSIDEFYRHKVPALLQVSAKAQTKLGNLPVAKLYPSDPVDFAEGDGIQGCRFAIQFRDSGGFDLKRWTSLNPVSIAWELLPLSFVIDYFYDIGNMLRNLESSLAYESAFVSGYYTELFAVQYSHRELGQRNKTSTGHSFFDAHASFTRKNFNRNVLSSMPAPRLPTFKLPTSWQQLITMAALCAVRLDPHAKKKR